MSFNEELPTFRRKVVRSSSQSGVRQYVDIRNDKARGNKVTSVFLKDIIARDTTIYFVWESSIQISPPEKNASRQCTGQECRHWIFSGMRYTYGMKSHGMWKRNYNQLSTNDKKLYPARETDGREFDMQND
jgi:hypothetical protein